MINKTSLPENFLLGVGTSAIQIEGNDTHSDWWMHDTSDKTFIKSGEHIGKAADHYIRFKDDLKLAKQLNIQVFRFTIEWSRIETSPGVYNQQTLDHYREVIQTLHSLDIEPLPTLHHFSSPSWLDEMGGWANPKSIEYFGKFADRMATEYGQDIKYWLTINEPTTYVGMGCIFGRFPPLKHNPILGLKVLKNMAKAHNLAYKKIKTHYPKAQVGTVNSCRLVTSKSGKTKGIFKNFYNYARNFYFPEMTKNSVDFLGLNYYSPTRLFGKPKGTRSDMGWEIYPKGLYDSTMTLWHRYKKPILITENGIATSNEPLRIEFIDSHLRAISLAMADGAKVMGYCYWTFLDNLELHEGYWPKFGLVHVDYAKGTLDRTIKDGGKYYADICKNISPGQPI